MAQLQPTRPKTGTLQSLHGNGEEIQALRETVARSSNRWKLKRQQMDHLKSQLQQNYLTRRSRPTPPPRRCRAVTIQAQARLRKPGNRPPRLSTGGPGLLQRGRSEDRASGL